MDVEIIAEIAQGFEGRAAQAGLLVRAAAAAGADAAKFQLVYADELATPGYKYYELFQTLEMADEVWADLARAASDLGIALHLDIFGARSLALAARIGAAAVKLHGTDIVNISLLEQVAASPVKRVLLGAGGAFGLEIERALSLLAGKQVTILLGFQGYPTPTDANHISRVARLAAAHADRPNVTIGFADHAAPDGPLAVALPCAAVGAGARVIEKHLTLGAVMKLEDHESALNPDQFAAFVATVRDVARAIGTTGAADDFGMAGSEQGYRAMIRRHVVTARALPAGTVLAPADLALKRTGSDAPLTDLAAVYGRRLTRSLDVNQAVQAGDLDAAGERA